MRFHSTLIILLSKCEQYKSTKLAFRYIDHETGLEAAGLVGTEIEAVRRDPGILSHTEEIPYPDFVRMTQNWGYVGSDVATIRKSIRQLLDQKKTRRVI